MLNKTQPRDLLRAAIAERNERQERVLSLQDCQLMLDRSILGFKLTLWPG